MSIRWIIQWPSTNMQKYVKFYYGYSPSLSLVPPSFASFFLFYLPPIPSHYYLSSFPYRLLPFLFHLYLLLSLHSFFSTFLLSLLIIICPLSLIVFFPFSFTCTSFFLFIISFLPPISPYLCLLFLNLTFASIYNLCTFYSFSC